ncbi:MAG TPA: LemA family protein [Bacteroidales bacterium]|nr:LemA family protein [Bacteroidales bacterium]
MNFKKWIAPGIIILSVIIVIMWAMRSYNSLVISQEKVEAQWANVENVYQRRADLIPNLVATVSGYADFERQTILEVIEARSKATAVNINPENLNAESLQQFQAAQAQIGGALSRLLVVVERYPELKANQSFLDLQSQLEGTENRISTERGRFNDAAREYNTNIRRFPRNMFANMFGFERKPYFEADEGAEEVPRVEF